MPYQVIDSPVDDITRKRRAVYTALFPYFTTEALLIAMWLWEDKYSSGNGGSIRQYVSEITQGSRYQNHTKKIYNALTANFLKPAHNLESDPMNMMLAYRAGKLNLAEEQVDPVLMKIPENIVFNFIMDNLHILIDKEDSYLARKSSEYLSANIYNLDLNIHQVKEIKQWVENHDSFIGMRYQAEELSRLLHIYYIGICEYYGPQKADSFLNLAIEMAENIPEAKHFSPKRLL